jgi:two-component system response regulator AtoC
MKKGIRGIEPDAMRTLKGHSWPGNIRELENAIERAILLAEGETISVGDLDLFASPEDRRGGEETVRLPPGGIHLQDAERAFITQALERCGWVQKKAAALLGLSSRVLNYRIKQFGITHPSWRQHR